MAVVIRLARMGHRNRPFYRISVADSRVAAIGKFLDQIGHYDPTKNPPEVKVDTVKALGWLKKGARPSDTVRSLFYRNGIMEKAEQIAVGKSKDTETLKPRAMAKRKKPKMHKQAKAAAAKAAATAASAPAAPAEAAPAA